MKKLKYTLLIAPPGGGKSTWLKSHSYDIKIDDISVTPNAIENLKQQLKELEKNKVSVAIADINLCDYEILKKAYSKLTEIATGYEVVFEHILFVGKKEQYLRNVEARADGRNVFASVVRFSPHILELEKKDLTNKKVIDISQYSLKPKKLTLK